MYEIVGSDAFIHEKTYFFFICPLRTRGGGQKAFADMSAKNVFFWTAPLRMRFSLISVLERCWDSLVYRPSPCSIDSGIDQYCT